jgi:hypothetical protein
MPRPPEDRDAPPAAEIADEDDLVDLDELFDLGGSGVRGAGSGA